MNVRSNTVSSSSGTTIWKGLILFIALAVNVSLIVRLFWGPQSFWVYTSLRERHEQLLAEIDSYDAANASLSRDIRLLQTDPRYLERVIRQRLNFVRDNEILYLFTDEQDNRGASTNDGKN